MLLACHIAPHTLHSPKSPLCPPLETPTLHFLRVRIYSYHIPYLVFGCSAAVSWHLFALPLMSMIYNLLLFIVSMKRKEFS